MRQAARPLLLVLTVAALCSFSACRRGEAMPAVATLRLRLAQDPATLDPARAVDAHSVAVVSQIFDGLVQFDPRDLSVRPALAESWEVSEDGLRYTFRLRTDATFHDGRPVTAGDVIYSFERVLSSSTHSPRRWVLRHLAGAGEFWDKRADRVAGLLMVDDRTVQLSLQEPFTPFLAHLCLEAASIVPRDVSDASRHPVGAGPFAFESWLPGERITLRRAGPRAARPGQVERVVYRIIASEAAALEEYLAGGLDVADEVPMGRRADLATRLGGQYRRWSQPAVAYLGFNHQAFPFRGNRKLRQAFSHAVDRQFIVKILNEGKDVVANGVIPPGVPGFDPHLEGYPYDPNRAGLLLAEAGYAGGKRLPEITLYYNTSATQQRIMEKVQMDLGRIGVSIRMKNLDPPALMKALESGEAALFRMAWLADYPDPDAFLTPTLYSSSGPAAGNYSRYQNPQFDRLIDRARGLRDPVERAALYRQAQRIVVEDACWLPLYFYGDEALVKPRVRGLTIPPLGDFLAPLASVTLEVEATRPGGAL